MARSGTVSSWLAVAAATFIGGALPWLGTALSGLPLLSAEPNSAHVSSQGRACLRQFMTCVTLFYRNACGSYLKADGWTPPPPPPLRVCGAWVALRSPR